jgi:hypothetical protein
MNRHFRITLRVLTSAIAILCLLAPSHAQTAKHAAHKPPAATPGASQAELDQIKQTIAEQHTQEQQRLDALQTENQQLGQQLKSAEEKLAQASEEIGRLSAGQIAPIAQLQSAVESLKSAEAATAGSLAKEQKLDQARDNPTALRYRGVTLTPGGYFAAESLYRSHAENAEINTSWASIPFDAQPMAHLSEFRVTARQTRLTLRADGALARAQVSSYFETDFLGSGFGASEVQTNGYSNRIRQMWGRVQFPSGWTFVGGQMWSLITTNRVGIENLAEQCPTLVDSTTFLGFDYARQVAVRVTKRFDASKVTAGFSAENAATVGITPANVPASVSSLLSGLSTTGVGALSNTTYSTNVAPDLIAKVAFDPSFGHFEIKAIGRTFRDRLDSTPAVAATKTTPAVPATPGTNNTLLGGGIGGAAYLPVFTRKVSYLAQGMWGAVGRYGATSTDVIIKPNGGLSVEKDLHAITGFETHPTMRMDWNVYASDEYLPRDYGYGLKTIDNTKCFIETGFSCSASTRNLEGGATSIWYRFYKGPAGTVQFGANYIYIRKNTWTGISGAPRGIESIIESSFRYYLP